MGKKTKTGKQRKDKFYHLAKETGFRSRAAFKLIQLNRKFEFLQRSRVLIDLCAAPGGWLQVAQKYMPVSSVIIGVDLVPIKPIPSVIAIQDDITSGSCRTKLKKELKTWKADIVLNDGAPNVGKSWVHDAYGQNVLTLHAVKLATEFLNKGGWFITKVFRSKDYQALMWVLKKLFRKVSATKPQASRHESAEIFVVCQSYIAPDKIDARFLDPAHLFSDVDLGEVAKLNPAHPEKQKPKVEGYPENDYTLYHRVPVMDFLKCDNHLEVLGQCSEIVIDDEQVLAHPLTTQEIKECCKDVKVLGRGDIKNLLTWRKKLKAWLEEASKEKHEEADEEADVEEVEDEDDEEVQLLKHAEEVSAEHAKELKKKKKKVLKQRKKLRDRMNLQMVLKDDQAIIEEDLDLFKLKAIKNKQQLSNVDEVDVGTLDPAQPLEEDEEDVDHRRKRVLYKKNALNEDWYTEEQRGNSADEDVDSDDDEHEELEFESDAEGDDRDGESDNEAAPEEDENPLVVDVAYGSVKNKRKELGKLWFEKDVFADIDDEEELLELEMMSAGKADKVNGQKKSEKKVAFSDATPMDTGEEKSVTALGSESKKTKSKPRASSSQSDKKAAEPPKKKQKRVKLDPEGLAIGTLMVQSQKAKRDIIDDGYNRYTFNDEGLPKWFVEEENKHNRKQMPETAEMVAEYRAQMKAVNARPIRKVAEAKARKKLRAAKKLEKARKRAETITDKLDMTDAEKAQQIRALYKKVLGKKDDGKVTYLVAKKATGRKVRRPPGVKGRFKVVDPRMKKDLRKKKAEMKKKR
ncbi:pre-rRNA 2'-O-ribose RNA methyltransferase FTSJ3 [Haemaphysalis longicornis]